MNASSSLLVQFDNNIARITLNRPKQLNALTREILKALKYGLEEASNRAEIRAVLISGSGRGFCAGQDLNERDPRILDTPVDLEATQKELFHPIIEIIQTMPKPVVACVNGIAAGAGSSIALSADIVIASTLAKFSQSFAKIGLSADAGGARALLLRLGSAKACAALMLSEIIDGRQAEQAGLIWKCVEADLLENETERVLAQLIATPKTALSSIKSAMRAAETSPDLKSYLLEEARLQGLAGAHSDYQEGVLAFLEKRSPNYS